MTSIDILVAAYRTPFLEALNSITAMARKTQLSGYDVHCPGFSNVGLPHWARNKLIAEVRKDADYVAFIDDDMVPEPDSLVKLLEHQAPIVSALCTTRGIPVTLAVKQWSEEHGTFLDIAAIKPGAVLKGKFACGAAFLVVSTKLLRQMQEHRLTARDWMIDNAGLFERIGADPEKIEAERKALEAVRRAHFKLKRHTRLFDFFTMPDDQQTGEDVEFCRKVIQLGVPVMIDSNVQVGHLGTYPYGPWNLSDEDPREALK